MTDSGSEPTSTPRDPLGLLLSPGLLAGLALLLVNDHVLKAALGNALTGKLSDVAGLWTFALVGSALLPRRRIAVHLATAVAFALWKSPAAQPAIDAWNAAVPVWTLARVVDPTDLLALPVLLLSWRYAAVARPLSARLTLRWAALGVATFAFVATSRVVSVEPPPSPPMGFASADELWEALRELDAADPDLHLSACDERDGGRIHLTLDVPGGCSAPDDGAAPVTAWVEAEEEAGGVGPGTDLLLVGSCREPDAAVIRAAWNERVLAPLRAMAEARSRRRPVPRDDGDAPTDDAADPDLHAAACSTGTP